MYQWWVFLHIIGAVGFLLSHGVATAITFRLRKERDPAAVSAMIQLSRSTVIPFYASTLVLLTAGIVAGFIGNWWGRAWIWTALIVLVVTSFAMFALTKSFYGRVYRAAEMEAAGERPIPGQDLHILLASKRPWLVAIIGYGALIVIVWLMVLKPF
jgi:uncharacterized membrane protein